MQKRATRRETWCYCRKGWNDILGLSQKLRDAKGVVMTCIITSILFSFATSRLGEKYNYYSLFSRKVAETQRYLDNIGVGKVISIISS